MGMTITEKIMAAHAGRDKVTPGQIVNLKLDLIYCHEVTTPAAVAMLGQHGLDRVFNPDRVVVTPDHFVPNKDIQAADLAARLREWAARHGITRYYEVGEHGICHAIIPEKGLVRPGMTLICGDSHTCTEGAAGAFATGVGSTDLAAGLAAGELWFKVPPTIRFWIHGKLKKHVYSKDIILHIISSIGCDGARYKAMEFLGPAVDALSFESRMTITNMVIEAGGKNGVMVADRTALDYLGQSPFADFEDTIYQPDQDAAYEREIDVDVEALEPMVAAPSLPSNGMPVGEVSGTRIHQAYLGSCTNGRIEDLRIAAAIVKGNRVAKGVRALCVPATTEVWKKALREGLLGIFSDAGWAVSTPTCGACLGGHMGVLARGEVCVSSTNRNFVGRMGHPESKVYLASPAVVAASSLTGTITDPREV